MDDFLTRIADRALGLAPVVRPLVGSRFEASRVRAGPAIDRDEQGASELPASVAEPASERPRPPRAATPAPGHAEPPATAASPRAEPVAPPAPAELRALVARSSSPAARRPAAPATARPRPSLALTGQPRSAEAAPSPSPETPEAEAPEPAGPWTQAATIESEADGTEPEGVAPTAEQPEPAPRSLARPDTSPRQRPVPPRRRSAGDDSRADGETIRVEIGRVEVRAAPPPAPAPAPAPPRGPRLSLDEYLRTRGLR